MLFFEHLHGVDNDVAVGVGVRYGEGKGFAFLKGVCAERYPLAVDGGGLSLVDGVFAFLRGGFDANRYVGGAVAGCGVSKADFVGAVCRRGKLELGVERLFFRRCRGGSRSRQRERSRCLFSRGRFFSLRCRRQQCRKISLSSGSLGLVPFST